MDFVNTYAATLPAHMRGYYDMVMAVSTEQVRFDLDIINKINTKQLGEKMIWYSGLPTARRLKEGQLSPRATVSTPYDKTWYTNRYGMAVVFDSKMINTDQSGMIKQAMEHLGLSHYNAYQRMVAGLLDNGTDTDYLGPDGKPLFATDHPISNGRTYSNLSTAQAFTPDAVQQMLTDVKAHKTWHNEPWIESRGYNLITGTGIEIKAQEAFQSANKAMEMSNTTNMLSKKPGGASVTPTTGNPFIQDGNGYWLVPKGKSNPLFVLTREEVKLREDDNVDWIWTCNSQADRVAGWIYSWGVQANEGA